MTLSEAVYYLNNLQEEDIVPFDEKIFIVPPKEREISSMKKRWTMTISMQLSVLKLGLTYNPLFQD